MVYNSQCKVQLSSTVSREGMKKTSAEDAHIPNHWLIFFVIVIYWEDMLELVTYSVQQKDLKLRTASYMTRQSQSAKMRVDLEVETIGKRQQQNKEIIEYQS